jgi:tetratricopeptide (TPR) repeat protein
MRATLGLVGLSLAWATLAAAQPQPADDLYKQGEDHYNRGEFEQAADAFKRGYELEPDAGKKPAYLFNVAVAYRQAHNCPEAVSYYKRFLFLKDSGEGKPLDAERRKEIDAALAECQPAPAPVPARTPVVAVSSSKDRDDDDEDEPARAPVATGPKLVVASVELGGSKLMAGNLDVPLEPALVVTVGHPFAIDRKTRVEVGGVVGIQSIPYTSAVTNMSVAGSRTLVLANVGATYAVAPKAELRGDLGLGLMVLAGTDQAGNPFTNAGEVSSGALAMFAVRAAVSGSYEITPNIVGTVTPLAFAFSPARSGLRSDITSISSVDFLVGLGYRM